MQYHISYQFKECIALRSNDQKQDLFRNSSFDTYTYKLYQNSCNSSVLSWIYTPTQSFFSSLSCMRISILGGGHEHSTIDPYQNAIPRAMLLHELKQVQLHTVCKLRKKNWASAGCPVHEIWTSAKDFGHP